MNNQSYFYYIFITLLLVMIIEFLRSLELFKSTFMDSFLIVIVKIISDGASSRFQDYIGKDCQSKKPSTESESNTHVHILVTGRSKSGKTATLKSILQNEIHEKDGLKHGRNFNSFGRSVDSVECQSFNEEMSEIHLIKNVKTALVFLRTCHVFLYCFRFEELLTESDKKYIEWLDKAFGKKFVSENMILVMTFGKNFETAKFKMGFNTFNEWLVGMKGCVLKDVINEFGCRCVLIENTTENVEKKEMQCRALFSNVDKIILEKSDIFKHISRLNAVEKTEHGESQIKDGGLLQSKVSLNSQNIEDNQSKKNLADKIYDRESNYIDINSSQEQAQVKEEFLETKNIELPDNSKIFKEPYKSTYSGCQHKEVRRRTQKESTGDQSDKCLEANDTEDLLESLNVKVFK